MCFPNWDCVGEQDSLILDSNQLASKLVNKYFSQDKLKKLLFINYQQPNSYLKYKVYLNQSVIEYANYVKYQLIILQKKSPRA